eukprot:724233-Prorocentrum_lima.AAC.1
MCRGEQRESRVEGRRGGKRRRWMGVRGCPVWGGGDTCSGEPCRRCNIGVWWIGCCECGGGPGGGRRDRRVRFGRGMSGRSRPTDLWSRG